MEVIDLVLKLFNFNITNDLQPVNKYSIDSTLFVLKLLKSKDVKDLHPKNI